jgi:Coiled-coil domain containing protein (DUF2052)
MTTPSTEDIRSTSPRPLSKTTIQNRRLTYLNRTDYVSSPLNQERLFPLLYEKLILRHKSKVEKLDEERSSKSRTLTNVLLDASDHMEKLQRQRDRTDEARARDDARHEEEQVIVETIPKNVLKDREMSRDFFEKVIRERFLAGGDEEFDYSNVDEDDVWDDWGTLEEDMRSKYFDDETPGNGEGEGRALTGETGIQDF